MTRWLLALAAIAPLTQGCSGNRESARDARPAMPRADAAIAWNELLYRAAEAEDGLLTLKGLRTASMLHGAVHDALATLDGRYRPLLRLEAVPLAHPLAAAAQAAHDVVADQYPDRREQWADELAVWLDRVPPGPARESGVALGRVAAAAHLAAREGDDWNAEVEYAWQPMAPGVYAELREQSGTPEGFVFGAGWARARPFVLDGLGAFRSPAPPPIESAEYARAFEEVRRVGRFESAFRSADETHLALWWKEFVESSHNRLARDLASARGLDLVTATRLFALLNMSIYDTYVSVFDNKFLYNHWRPYTAIRWADHDGNPATESDPEWDTTCRHTYPFPSYPSAHGAACAAAMTVLAESFGSDRPFDMTIEEVDRAGPFSEKLRMEPPTRSFPDFAAAARECALSRILLGIHFRYDSEEGTRLGTAIGEYVVAHAMTPR